MDKMFSKKYLVVLTAMAFMAYFSFWWLFRLDILPGLHGDEAWAGLKAHDYKLLGVSQLSGMTPYTGILQNLMAEISFDLFGIGVYQLRFPGAILNILSMLIAAIGFLRLKAYRQLYFFMLLIGSSALLLISARVAWEVNSLTFLFIALSFLSLIELNIMSGTRIFWVSLFFTVNILGTYNHVIFSCVPVSAFCGLFLWSNFNKSNKYKDLLNLLAVNFLSVCSVFLLMRYQLDFIYDHLVYLPFIFLLFVLALHGAYLRLNTVNYKYSTLIPASIIKLLLTLFVLGFIYFHGLAFFEMLSGYKVILQFYSYESSLLFTIGYILCGAIFLSYLANYILTDFSDPEMSIPAFFVLSYLGFFSFYTIKDSFRYYLAIYIIMSIYLSFKLAKSRLDRKPFVISQVILLMLLNAQLLDVFLNNPIAVRAVDFKIGFDQAETTAHFLPKEPLIEFLKKENIGRINYLAEPYFIEQPIKFYKLFVPWQELPQNEALIDYDHFKYKSGFHLVKEK